MTQESTISLIIPVLNEQDSIGKVLGHLSERFKSCVIVVDNGSTDNTVNEAKKWGVHVITCPKRGYGSACLAGVDYARQFNPEILAFIDGDYSDFPEDLEDLYNALETQNLDLIIGSRTSGRASKGALLPQARFGNWLATFLLSLIYKYRFSDLGPMRMIRYKSYSSLKMLDPNFGWTVEMQAKALKQKLKVGEVPVRYRQRIGKSKITGTVKGSLLAGYKILWTIFKVAIQIKSKRS